MSVQQMKQLKGDVLPMISDNTPPFSSFIKLLT